MPRKLLALITSVWLIAAAAFLARVTFFWDQQRKIPHNILATVPFEQEVGNIASAIAQGQGFSNVFRQPTGPTAWLAPIYPTLLAAIFRIFGTFTYSSFFAAVILNCIFSAAATVPLFFAARRIGGIAVAALSAWLWALYPNAVMLPFEWIWDTSLSAFLAAAILWATLELTESTKPLDWIAYGILWGVALLTNPALGIFLPFLLLWLAVRRISSGTRVSIKFPLLTLAVTFLCCVPWTIRNYTQFHRLIPIRGNFPFELWLGNNDIFDEHAVGGIQRITRFGEARLYAQLGETAFMDRKRGLAWNFINTHRSLELQLIKRRMTATWLGTESPWRDFRSTDSALIRIIFIGNAIVALGTLSGLVLLFLRRNPYAIPLALIPLLFPVVYYITHTSLRYRHPMDPTLLLLTAVAFASLFGARKI
ncbi:MAG: glycosyltransferase family 39 protein, partial [Acidobacteria bacterium]|nr:glycosyltransferase family 39 protein [Acidobacteriota bacterium]